MDKVFKSKIDKLIIIRIILLCTAFFVYLYILHARVHDLTTLITGYFLGIIILVPFGILLPLRTTYKVTHDGLLIVPAGLRKIKIDIRDISSIKTENSWIDFIFTSYVNSLDQIKLTYKENSGIRVSPSDREEFIKALQNYNPGLTSR